MAFLCPVRIRRNKKNKHGGQYALEKDRSSELGLSSRTPIPPGRITGSASIETLVRVGIEKENGLSPDSKMVIIHDFTPCVDDELQVKRGQIVNVLYRENDWVYVIAAETRMEGFVPHSYCAPYASQLAETTLALMNNVKKKLPRSLDDNDLVIGSERLQNLDCNNQHTDTGSASDCESYARNVVTAADINVPRCVSRSQNSIRTPHSQPEIHPFYKEPSAGRYIVLYTFVARDENDLSVERGEFVTVLNRDDPDWFWVLRHCDGSEGFVPSGFVYPGHVINSSNAISCNSETNDIGTGANETVSLVSSSNNNNNNNNNNNVNNNNNNNNCNNSVGSSNSSSKNNINSNNNNNNNNDQHRPKELTSHRSSEEHPSGTELVVLYDYKAQAPDDLSVKRADWIYADLGNQTVDGWLWAYAPKTRKYGFIPKAYARPPAMTSL